MGRAFPLRIFFDMRLSVLGFVRCCFVALVLLLAFPWGRLLEAFEASRDHSPSDGELMIYNLLIFSDHRLTYVGVLNLHREQRVGWGWTMSRHIDRLSVIRDAPRSVPCLSVSTAFHTPWHPLPVYFWWSACVLLDYISV